MTHAASGADLRMPRIGSAAQLGQELGPIGQLLLDHGAENRLIDVPVHLVPIDTPKRWMRVVLDRQLDPSGGRLIRQPGDQGPGPCRCRPTPRPR
jgi:hypothetical protein